MSQFPVNCPGPFGRMPVPHAGAMGRRELLRIGMAGLGGLSLPGILRARAETPAAGKQPTAVIMVWLPGGASHIDTYDPKPDISSEYRGPFQTIQTKIPGVQFTELLPRQARIADKFTVLRSMQQTAGGHPAGSMQMLSGDPDTRDKPKPKYPDWMTVANYLRAKEGPRDNPLPRYVGVSPPLEYNGPAYLGDAYQPFVVSGDPNQPSFTVPHIGTASGRDGARLDRRVALRRQFDSLERAIEKQSDFQALDQFETQAMTLLTNARTKEAFDLSREDDSGRHRHHATRRSVVWPGRQLGRPCRQSPCL